MLNKKSVDDINVKGKKVLVRCDFNVPLIDFNLEYAGQDTATLLATADVSNDYTKVEISKVDIGGEEIPGAELEIRDSEGNTIESWTSDGTPHMIERFSYSIR